MKMPADQIIGIVTVLYNSNDVLPGFFSSISSQQGINYRLYVIDNSPNDSGTRISEEAAKLLKIDAVCIFNNENVGVAKGNNQGIELALKDGCSHILLANNDTEFAPTTIFKLWEDMVKNGEYASTPKLMYYDTPDIIWYAGGHINPWTMRTPHYGLNEKDNGQFDMKCHVNYAPTCFMLVDSTVFEKVGRMDERYFVYSDDTDFVWRMNILGMNISYNPEAVVLHKVSTSTGGASSPFTQYYSNRNRIFFIRKNLHGLQKAIALTYVLTTRILRLGIAKTNNSGWKGIRDGLSMQV